MSGSGPRIGVPVDVKHVSGESFHGVGEKYIAALAHGAGALPLLLPALGEGAEMAALTGFMSPDEILEGLDGLFLTGSPSNLAPWRYGGAGEGVGPFDPQRDETTLALLRAALDRDLPVLAVCRGFQELNVICGGTLCAAVHERPGRMDHREDHDLPRAERYQPAHPVRLAADGLLARLAGSEEVMVNSLHGQGVDRPGDGLVVEATAPDGLIEAVRLPGHRFVMGVQWHPEWQFAENPLSRALFAAFGDAARRRRAAVASCKFQVESGGFVP